MLIEWLKHWDKCSMPVVSILIQCSELEDEMSELVKYTE